MNVKAILSAVLLFSIGAAHLAAGSERSSAAQAVNAPGRTNVKHAKGEFEVQVVPQGETDKGPGSSLGRMSLDKQFRGNLEGTSKGTMLTAMSEVKGSGAYVAIERFTGTLEGHSGSFALSHRGVMSGGKQTLSLDVVPDSGSGALTGIVGTMTIAIIDGKHHYELDYTLPSP